MRSSVLLRTLAEGQYAALNRFTTRTAGGQRPVWVDADCQRKRKRAAPPAAPLALTASVVRGIEKLRPEHVSVLRVLQRRLCGADGATLSAFNSALSEPVTATPNLDTPCMFVTSSRPAAAAAPRHEDALPTLAGSMRRVRANLGGEEDAYATTSVRQRILDLQRRCSQGFDAFVRGYCAYAKEQAPRAKKTGGAARCVVVHVCDNHLHCVAPAHAVVVPRARLDTLRSAWKDVSGSVMGLCDGRRRAGGGHVDVVQVARKGLLLNDAADYARLHAESRE